MLPKRGRTLHPTKRVRTFQEVHLGLSRKEAMDHARIYLDRERAVRGDGCPLGTDLFAVLRFVAKGDHSSALHKVLEADPLPSVTSRVLSDPHLETQAFDQRAEKVSLRAVIRFIADHARLSKTAGAPPSKRRVAIIGSGVSGVSATHFLKAKGFQPTVFESSHVLGGRLSYAYPEFRVPSKVVSSVFSRLSDEGVVFHKNVVFGRDVFARSLFEQGFSAVILACGAGVSGVLGVPGEEAAGVIPVNELLKLRHWMKAGIPPYTTPLNIGHNVVIAGSGEKAFDVARFLIRVGRKVVLIVPGSDSHLGVDPLIAREAIEEGVTIRTFLRLKEVLKTATGCAKGAIFEHLDYRIDGQGKLNMVAQKDADEKVDLDTLITVAEDLPETLFLRGQQGIELDAKGAVEVLSGTESATLAEGVFACGRVVDPTMSIVDVINSTKRMVDEVEGYLNS